jgi:hypothetical protein
MGWAFGDVDGREVGYGVVACCDQEGCSTEITRGLDYCCGGQHGGSDEGCGGYFCEQHRVFSLCLRCFAAWEAAHPEVDALPATP